MDNKEKIKLLLDIEDVGIFSFGALTTYDINDPNNRITKKARSTKEPTPANLERIYKVFISTVSLGNDYETAVNNRREKEGLDRSFKRQSSYAVPYKGSRLVYVNKETGQAYLRVYPNLCHSFHTLIAYYDKNGKPLSTPEITKIKAEYLPAEKTYDQQGLSDPILVKNYKLDNVKWVKRGDFVLQEIPYEMFKKMVG